MVLSPEPLGFSHGEVQLHSQPGDIRIIVHSCGKMVKESAKRQQGTLRSPSRSANMAGSILSSAVLLYLEGPGRSGQEA